METICLCNYCCKAVSSGLRGSRKRNYCPVKTLRKLDKKQPRKNQCLQSISASKPTIQPPPSPPSLLNLPLVRPFQRNKIYHINTIYCKRHAPNAYINALTTICLECSSRASWGILNLHPIYCTIHGPNRSNTIINLNTNKCRMCNSIASYKIRECD